MNEQEYLQNEIRQGQRALRWLIMSTILMVLSFIAQVTAIVMWIQKNPNTKIAVILFAGFWLLGIYSHWVAETYKPESWKR